MSHTQKQNRREFICSASTLAGVGLAAPYFFLGGDARAENFASKNDRPVVGLIGAGSRGGYLAKWAANFGDIAAVCDVDLRHAERVKKIFGGKPAVYQDYRRLLERKDIEIVLNATPDHWHTAINISACRAGKDVYAEKPLTLTIDEGKLLCKVVEDTGRIVQVGTNQRSEANFQTAIELVRNGRLGKLKQVWVAVPYYSTVGGPFPTETPPAELDWDFYQGQAPEHDYCPQRTHRTFRWWYEYAGGIITDWGNHHIDIAHWGMDCELTGPVSVEARGLFPNPAGPQYYNTPDRFFCRMIYPNGLELLYVTAFGERQNLGQKDETPQQTPPEQIEWLFGKDVPEEIKAFERNGIMFIGERSRVFVNRGGVYGAPAEDLKSNPLPSNAWRVRPNSDHMADFFECVKTRKQPCAPVQIEHRSVTACHLVNISIRLKRKLTWDPVQQAIVGDAEADAWQKRPQRKPYSFEDLV